VGLGLSIAQRIAELHAAEMRLHTWRDDRGFCVELEFPAER
jgi:nitrogen fixation/metabolism regulation signal transduction histidine kinase